MWIDPTRSMTTPFLVDRIIIWCKMHCSSQQKPRWENFCEEKASLWSQQIQLITSSETGTLYVSWDSSLLCRDMSQIQTCPSPFWMCWLLHTADHLPHNGYFGLCAGFTATSNSWAYKDALEEIMLLYHTCTSYSVTGSLYPQVLTQMSAHSVKWWLCHE